MQQCLISYKFVKEFFYKLFSMEHDQVKTKLIEGIIYQELQC